MSTSINIESGADDAVEYSVRLSQLLARNNTRSSSRSNKRLVNNGKRQHRRFTGYDQNFPMVVYGYREQTVHGTSSDGATPLTIVVFRWHLQKRKLGRRFKAATLRAIFSTRRRKQKYEGRGGNDKSDNGIDNPKHINHYYDPHVAAVAPNGSYVLQPTVTDVTVARTRAVEGNTNINAGAGPVTSQLGGSISYQLATTVTATDCVTIHGSERIEYDSKNTGGADRCNVAKWQLFENKATRSGLPSELYTAVRLEWRPLDQSEFTVRFEIKTHVDSLTDKLMALKRFVRLVPRDEPIIFDPTLEENGPLAAWKDRLDKKDLFEECKMVMFHSMPGSK